MMFATKGQLETYSLLRITKVRLHTFDPSKSCLGWEPLNGFGVTKYNNNQLSSCKICNMEAIWNHFQVEKKGDNRKDYHVIKMS